MQTNTAPPPQSLDTVMLVGNKCDLEGFRKVRTSEGKDLAACLGMMFYEASAKTRVNLENVFYDLVRALRKKHGWVPPEQRDQKQLEKKNEEKKRKRRCTVS